VKGLSAVGFATLARLPALAGFLEAIGLIESQEGMRADLRVLRIPEREVRRLSGLAVERIRRHAALRTDWRRFAREAALTWLLFAPLCVGAAWVLWRDVLPGLVGAALPELTTALAGALATAFALALPVAGYRHSGRVRTRRTFRSLIALMEEIDTHNRIVRALDVRDRLAEAGSSPPLPEERQVLVETLVRVRAELVRALKTERILRENRDLIELGAGPLEVGMVPEEARRLNEAGGAYATLINQAVGVGVQVQEEMRRLRENRSPSEASL
jgi:hypothetical protein